MTLSTKIALVCALIILIIQGTTIFRDAMKKNIPNPWLWGIIGLVQAPWPTIIYLIYRKRYFSRKNKGA
ncbi:MULTISPECIES: sigma-Y antisigma factor component [Clostridium]|uniref:Sigma-Y antisigma factor component n=1 Tax=Clostridium cibarium TaxID=2762247 RepID=A0ABR8PU81_9CLOT|nr:MULTISPECIES: sigma-Y antisigma factor component [Clostridium]MBD7911717.1 sigma-Y antisigma factor component [Clostridium cibarium]